MQWIPKIIELKSLFIPEVVYETCFYYFWEGKCLLHLNLFFINNYFWVHRPNSSMKGDEGGSFSKASDWKFLIKIKIKTQAAQIRNTIQPSSTFIRISLGLFQIYWNIFFHENWQFNHKLSPHSFSYKHTVPERLSSQLKKIWNHEDLKNSNFFCLLVNWEKSGSTTLTYIEKAQFHNFFMDWEYKEVQLEQHSKSICELGKTLKSSIRTTGKKLSFESMNK